VPIRLIALGAILFSGVAQPQEMSRSAKPESNADKASFEQVCGACHAPSMVNGFRSAPDWRETVANMVEIGARGTDEQLAGVMRYLRRFWTTINVNTATAEELTETIGISDSVAQAIVRYRTGHGNFKTCDDLSKVPGATRLLESCRSRVAF
jgi:competence ComEA-like helix-hairpin-helix protein